MSETMAHNIGNALAALPGALGYKTESGCIVTTFLQIDPNSEDDAYGRRQAQASGQHTSLEPGVTHPDGTYEAVLAGLPPYWLPLEEIDPDTASYDTVLNARTDGLRLLADLGFNVTEELTPDSTEEHSAEEQDSAEEQHSTSPRQCEINEDSELFSRLRYMIVLIDTDEYSKAYENDGHLYRIYERFIQERSAITPVTPAIIVVTDRLETGAGFYALNNLSDMELFSGTIDSIETHPRTREYEKLHNQHIPYSQLQARDRYKVGSPCNETALSADPLAKYITEYVVAEQHRVVDATESQFFLDKDDLTDEEITIGDRAVDAGYRRCVHRLTHLVESARSLVVLNGYGAQIEGSDLRVLLEKTAYLLSYSTRSSIYDMFHQVLEAPLFFADTAEGDNVPEEVRALLGNTEITRLIRIALETLVSLNLRGHALSDETADCITTNALRTLLCDAAVRRDYNTYHMLADAFMTHTDAVLDSDSADNNSADPMMDLVRQLCMSPGGMAVLAQGEQEVVAHVAMELVNYSVNHPGPFNDLDVTDDIDAEVRDNTVVRNNTVNP